MRNCFIFSHGSTSMDVAISRDRELRGGGTFRPHAWYVASLGCPWDREQLTAFQRRAERGGNLHRASALTWVIGSHLTKSGKIFKGARRRTPETKLNALPLAVPEQGCRDRSWRSEF